MTGIRLVKEQIKQNPNNIENMWKTIRSYIPKKPANIKSFTKDDQNVAKGIQRVFELGWKSTMEKIQLLAKKFNYASVQDLCISKNYRSCLRPVFFHHGGMFSG